MTRYLIAALFLSFALEASAAEWYVDNAAAAGGDGSASAPFQSLAAAQKASGAGDVILVRPGNGPYREPVRLQETQQLVGTGGVPQIGPLDQPAVTLAAATTIRNLKVHAEAHDAIVGNAVGQVRIEDVVVAVSGGGNGVVLVDGRGAITLERVTIRATGAGTSLVVRGSQGVVMKDGTSIESTGGRAMHLSDSHVIIDLAKLVIDGRGTVEEGATLERLTGRVTIAGGGVKDVLYRGIAMHDVENVTLENVEFARASMRDGDGCGRPTEPDAYRRCNGALHLRNVRQVSLRGVTVVDSAQHGIFGDVVSGLSIDGSVVDRNGDAVDESGIMLRDATGQVHLSGTKARGNASRQIELTTSGNLELRLDGVEAGPGPSETSQQGLLLSAGANATASVTMLKSRISGVTTSGIHVIAAANADVAVNITGSTFDDNGSAVVLASGDEAKLTYELAENSIGRHSTTALTVTSLSRIGARGSIVRNRFGADAKPASAASCGGGCAAISVTGGGDGTSSAQISNNTLFGSDVAIRARSADRGTLDAVIQANTIGGRAAGTNPAIVVQAGARPNDSARICVDIGGANGLANDISWAGEGPAVQLVHRFPSTRFYVAGFAGSPDAAEQAAKFVAGRNTGARVTANVTAPLSIADTCGPEDE